MRDAGLRCVEADRRPGRGFTTALHPERERVPSIVKAQFAQSCRDGANARFDPSARAQPRAADQRWLLVSSMEDLLFHPPHQGEKIQKWMGLFYSRVAGLPPGLLPAQERAFPARLPRAPVPSAKLLDTAGNTPV
jgi:hypothetical protein